MGINLAIIPARGGSKGIPMKNIKKIAGKPLVIWTIESARQAKLVDEIVVSSDSLEIRELAIQHGIKAIDRSKGLEKDNIHAIYVIIDCLHFFEKKGIIVDKVAMLLPTAPLRKAEDIDNAFNILYNGDSSSVVGVCKCDKPQSNFRYINNNILYPIMPVNKFEIQRQEIKNPIYEVNGAIFVANKKHINVYKSFHAGNPAPYVMSKINSIDINDMEDFQIAEVMLKHGL
jgi:CMP-N-acetylneuraminic acid synthetase